MSTLQATNLKHGSSVSNNIVLDASGNTTISGNATITGTLQANGVTGSVYPLVLGTAQTSTSGTTIDFTGIPSWVKRVTVLLRGVSISGTDNYLIQIGSGSFLTSGYVSQAQGLRDAGSTVNALSTTGFILSADTNSAARVFTGRVTLSSMTGNVWLADGVLVATDGIRSAISSGEITLSGALDRLRVTTTGTNTFDAGSINIMYEG